MKKAIIGTFFKKESLNKAKQYAIKKEARFNKSYGIIEFEDGYLVTTLKQILILRVEKRE